MSFVSRLPSVQRTRGPPCPSNKCIALKRVQLNPTMFCCLYFPRQEVCAKIDAVTADDLMKVARRALATPPSLSVVGSNIDGIPTHEQVCSWFMNPQMEGVRQRL